MRGGLRWMSKRSGSANSRRIAVGRGIEEHHRPVLAHRLAVQRHVVLHRAHQELRRHVVAERLVVGVGISAGSWRPGALVLVLPEPVHGAGERLREGLGAPDHEHREVRRGSSSANFRPSISAPISEVDHGLARERRPRGASWISSDEVAEHLVHRGEAVGRHARRVLLVAGEEAPDEPVQHGRVLEREAVREARDLHRDLRREVVEEVGLRLPFDVGERLVDEARGSAPRAAHRARREERAIGERRLRVLAADPSG